MFYGFFPRRERLEVGSREADGIRRRAPGASRDCKGNSNPGGLKAVPGADSASFLHAGRWNARISKKKIRVFRCRRGLRVKIRRERRPRPVVREGAVQYAADTTQAPLKCRGHDVVLPGAVFKMGEKQKGDDHEPTRPRS
jgi:hypothetical protein